MQVSLHPPSPGSSRVMGKRGLEARFLCRRGLDMKARLQKLHKWAEDCAGGTCEGVPWGVKEPGPVGMRIPLPGF